MRGRAYLYFLFSVTVSQPRSNMFPISLSIYLPRLITVMDIFMMTASNHPRFHAISIIRTVLFEDNRVWAVKVGRADSPPELASFDSISVNRFFHKDCPFNSPLGLTMTSLSPSKMLLLPFPYSSWRSQIDTS